MILVRAIKPATPFKSSIFREEITAAAKQTQKDMLDDFQRTTATWKNKPKFETKIEIGAGAGGVRITVTTDSDIYKFVDKGTRVRYATMSKDWKSKTTPNEIMSEPGRGRKLFVNKKIKRPGIKARNFTKIIARTYRKEFSDAVKNALARAARRSGHGIK